jgi:hypothetical protein
LVLSRVCPSSAIACGTPECLCWCCHACVHQVQLRVALPSVCVGVVTRVSIKCNCVWRSWVSLLVLSRVCPCSAMCVALLNGSVGAVTRVSMQCNECGAPEWLCWCCLSRLCPCRAMRVACRSHGQFICSRCTLLQHVRIHFYSECIPFFEASGNITPSGHFCVNHIECNIIDKYV